MEETTQQRRHRLLVEKLELGLSRVRQSWTQQSVWVDKDGEPCDRDNAVSWSLEGALFKPGDFMLPDALVRKHALSELSKTVSELHPDLGGDTYAFNQAPTRTQAHVVELFEKTLARVKAVPDAV